jgi:hypothetical protein
MKCLVMYFSSVMDKYGFQGAVFAFFHVVVNEIHKR